MLARLEQAKGNLEQAQEAMRIAEQIASEAPYKFILVKCDLARLWLAQGNLERLTQYIQKSGLSIEDEIPYQQEPEYMILVRVLLAQNDYETGLALSRRLLQQAEATGRMELLIETLILQALVIYGKKDPENALAILERALSLAQPEGYVRIFLDEGDAMTRLLCQVQAYQVGSSYATDLLAKIGRISNMTQPSMQILIEPLTARELEVLTLIEAGYSNQGISEKLFISITTVKRHISNIYTKLGVESRTQAIALGKELRLFG
jgi:LuxR family maltose regulon positive regulatory protein